MVFVENVIDLLALMSPSTVNPLTVDLVNDVEQQFVCLLVSPSPILLAYSYMILLLMFVVFVGNSSFSQMVSLRIC